MDQKEIQKNEITNKINSIKCLYEKKNNDNLDINPYQSQLREYEKIREGKKFSDITKKFGLHTLVNNAESFQEIDMTAELKRIRGSIITSNLEDFNARREKFAGKKQSTTSTTNQNTDTPSPDKIKGLIEETNSILENYEKEINFLRYKINELEKVKEKEDFKVLELQEIHSFNLDSCKKSTFMNHMKFFADKDPGLSDFANAYNDKICELFEENEKLQNSLKSQKNSEKELDFFKNAVNERDEQIKNINDIYCTKFTELFSENANLTSRIEIITKQRDDIEEKYKIENKLIRITLVKKEENINELENKYNNMEKHLNEKINILENQKRIIESEKTDSNLVNNTLQINVNDLELQITKYIEDIENLKNVNNKYLNEIENLKNQNLIQIENITNLEKDVKLKNSEIISLKNSIEEDSLKQVEINNSHSKDKLQLETQFKKKQEELKDITKSFTELESNSKQINEENQNLREVIAKDQMRLKELKEFKKITELKNEETNLINEENLLLKNEIKLVQKHLDDERILNEISLNKQKDEMEILKEELTKKLCDKDKIIDNLQKDVKNLLERLKELEESVKNFSKNLILERRETGEIKISTNTLVYSTFNEFALTRELMIDYIYYLYLYDNSINLQQMVDILLNNFTFYLSSIFLNKDNKEGNTNANNNFRLPFSLTHEFLEDMYLVIYDTYMKNKLIQNKVIYNDMWILNSEDISLEIIKEVTKIIENNNILTLINSINKRQKSIDDIINIFLNKYEKSFQYGSHNLSEYIDMEVRPILLEKIEKYNKTLNGELQALVQYAVANFHSGKIIYNGKQVYDFKEFFMEYLSRDTSNKETLQVENLATINSVDNIAINIKLNSKNLRSIFFNGSFLSKSQNALGRLSLTLMMYSPGIINLSITNCLLTESQLMNITKLIEFLKNLKFLDLSGNDLKEDGIKILAESLKTNRNIEALYLDRNEINENGGFYIADALIKNHTIEKLSLSGNRINEGGLSSLLTVLSNSNNNIRYLDLSDNSLTVEDFKNISEFIQTNQTLNILNISYNVMNPEAAHYIGLSLKFLKGLSVLYIKNNNINEETAPLLLKFLPFTKLSEIYFDENPLGEIGAILLANALKQNSPVKLVSLKKCKLTSMSLMCLSKVIETNNFLEVVNLEENLFDEVSLTGLCKSLKNKSIKIFMSNSQLNLKTKEIIRNNDNFILY